MKTDTPVTLPPDNYDRRRFIGSSDIAAIMGMAPRFADGSQETAVSVYERKIAEVPGEMEPKKKLFLERRKRWEPVVVQMLREELDAEVVSTNLRYIDPDLPYFAAEIDFEWRDPDDGLIRSGEIKSVSPRAYSEKFGWGDPGTGDIPEHYELQVQFAFGVRRLPSPTIVAAMVGLDDLLLYKIDRDDFVVAAAREAATKFWNENVLKHVPPEPTTVEDLAKLYPQAVGGLSVNASDDVGSKALQLRGIKASMGALTAQAEALEFDLKLAMKTAESITVDGRKLFSWKSEKWSRLNTEDLKKQEKEIYKRFLKTGTHRVLRQSYS